MTLSDQFLSISISNPAFANPFAISRSLSRFHGYRQSVPYQIQ